VTVKEQMDELKKLTCSRRAHKGHLTKLLTATDDILYRISTAKETNADPTSVSSDVVLLEENLKQLHLKADHLSSLDDKIIAITILSSPHHNVKSKVVAKKLL